MASFRDGPQERHIHRFTTEDPQHLCCGQRSARVVGPAPIPLADAKLGAWVLVRNPFLQPGQVGERFGNRVTDPTFVLVAFVPQAAGAAEAKFHQTLAAPFTVDAAGLRVVVAGQYIQQPPAFGLLVRGHFPQIPGDQRHLAVGLVVGFGAVIVGSLIGR